MKLKFAAGIMLACFMAVVFSCQTDDATPEHKHDSGIRENKITFEDLQKMPNAMKIINRINEKGTAGAPNHRTIYDAENDFFINTDDILRIDNGDYHSLTFTVSRLEGSNVTENLVLSEEENGDYKAYLYTYDLTEEETYDLMHGTPTLITNPIDRKEITFDSGQVAQRLIQIFYTEVVVVECSEHVHGIKNFGEWSTCGATRKPQILVVTRSVLVDDGNGNGWVEGGNYSGGDSSGGGSGTYNPNITPFDPKDDLALIRGNITKPRPNHPTPEQNFYNNDLGGNNIHLRAVMNNPEVREPLLQYLALYNFLQPNRNLAVAMLQTIFDGGEVDIVNRVLLDPSFTENPCLNGIYTDLGKAPTFQNYLNNFDGDFSVANLKLSAGDVDGHAVTNFPNNYLIEIKFDTGILSEVPTLDVVGTFIHEMIHAEIFRKLMSVAGTGSLQYNNWTPSQWKTYLETMKNDFPGLYDYYLRYESNVAVDGVLNEFQHQMMAQHYRDIIIDVLKEYDNTQTEEVYEAIAWIGLMGKGPINPMTGLPTNPTVAWQNIPQAERLQILSTYNNFKNSNLPCQS